jgi:hypothetical protein
LPPPRALHYRAAEEEEEDGDLFIAVVTGSISLSFFFSFFFPTAQPWQMGPAGEDLLVTI